jgi:hypothetical protein
VGRCPRTSKRAARTCRRFSLDPRDGWLRGAQRGSLRGPVSVPWDRRSGGGRPGPVRKRRPGHSGERPCARPAKLVLCSEDSNRVRTDSWCRTSGTDRGWCWVARLSLQAWRKTDRKATSQSLRTCDIRHRRSFLCELRSALLKNFDKLTPLMQQDVNPRPADWTFPSSEKNEAAGIVRKPNRLVSPRQSRSKTTRIKPAHQFAPGGRGRNKSNTDWAEVAQGIRASGR